MIKTALALCKGPECESLRRHLSALFDGELDAAARRRAGRHLKTCPTCAKEYAMFSAMVEACRDLPEPKLSAACRGRIRRAYRAWARTSQGGRTKPAKEA